MATDRDWEDRMAAEADKLMFCVCGDHDSDHFADVFVARRPGDEPGRACIVPFCRCTRFTPMAKWRPW